MIDLDQIKKAIAHVEADGWRIITGEWCHLPTKECCPLVAACIALTGAPPVDEVEAEEWDKGRRIATLLDMPPTAVYRFADGFDSGRPPSEYAAEEEHPMRKLGREVREFTNGE